MLQVKQRGAYFTYQTVTVTWILVHVLVWSAEAKPDDMAGLVAAVDASPLAAVLAAPRGEEAGGVACDALFEGEQGGPLGGDATTTMGARGLRRTTREE